MSSAIRSKFQVINFEAAPGVFAVRLQEDSSRRFLQIQNKGESSVYVNFGDSVATEANSIRIPAGALYEPWACPVNEIKISAASDAAGTSLVVLITDSSTAVANK